MKVATKWRWGRKLLGVQLAAVALVAYACSRAPSGIESERYSVDGMRATEATEVSGVAVGEAEEEAGVVHDVPADSGMYNPPTHTAPSNWHVLDTAVGPKTGPGAIHRLATQWHNSMTSWWFWVPVTPPTPPKWRGPFVGTVPSAEAEPVTAEEGGSVTTSGSSTTSSSE